MDRLHQLVSEGLKQKSAGPHPEADTLTAFAEDALGRPERQQLMEHLAACPDCRKILYLAQPDAGATQPTLVFRPNRVTHFAVRWGAVAASLVIVAGGLFITRHELFVSRQPTTQQPVPSYYDRLAERKASPELDSVRNAEAAGAKQQSKAETKTRPAEKHMTAKPQASMTFDESGQVRVNETGAPGAALATESATKMGSNGPSATYDKKSKQRDESAATDALPAASVNAVGGIVAENKTEAKDIPRTRNESVAVAAAAPVLQAESEPVADAGAAAKTGDSRRDNRAFKQNGALMKTLSSPAASWELAPDGSVRRSLDSGKSWQSVDVGKSATFRTIFSSGSQVWVGGAAGVLYHSTDSGLTWAPVVVSADGQTLKADIGRIEFSDAQNGSLWTTSDETWSTADGGQSWRRKSTSPAK